MAEHITIRRGRTQLVLRVPQVPNFILTTEEDKSVPIEQLTDGELRAVAKAWTARLVARATERAARRTP
jgi:hypothetical protein